MAICKKIFLLVLKLDTVGSKLKLGCDNDTLGICFISFSQETAKYTAKKLKTEQDMFLLPKRLIGVQLFFAKSSQPFRRIVVLRSNLNLKPVL